MASYRLSLSIVSRGKGKSAVAKAAYNARENIRDERTGEMKRYSDRPGLKLKGIAAPKNAPDWVHDRGKLWNEVEAREDKSSRRDTARLAREFELNFPHELSLEEQRRLLRDFIREEFTRHGMIVDWAIHAADIEEPGEPEEDRSHGGGHGDDRDGEPQEHGKNANPHAHLMVPTRAIGPDGFGDKVREWDSKEQMNRWREKWAELGARYLKNAGHEVEAEHYKVAHHTLVKQREIALERGDLAYAETLDRAPQKHLGPTVIAMMRRGAETEIGNAYRDDLKYANDEAADRADIRQLDRQIAERRREIEPAPEDPDPAQAPPALQPEPAAPLVASHRIEATGGGHEDPQRIEPKPPPDHAQRPPLFEHHSQRREIAQALERARKKFMAALSAEWPERPHDLFRQAKTEAPQPSPATLFAQAKKYVIEHYLPELAKLRPSPDRFLQIFTAFHEANDKITERLRGMHASRDLFTGSRETALATPKPPPPPPPKKRVVLSFKPPDPDRSR